MHQYLRLPSAGRAGVLACAVLTLIVVSLGLTGVSSTSSDAARTKRSADRNYGPLKLNVMQPATSAPPRPLAASTPWSGFAFDACRAPSQEVMDRWRTSSPFTGVGIYLGGIHRACEQKHLSAAWVKRQRARGWNLLPIWVGPQASCTGYHHRINGKPGDAGDFQAAQVRGTREARQAAEAARALGIPEGEEIFYDLEPFDVSQTSCRRSSLTFLESWTVQLHLLGYRSGVYSHAKAGIALLSRTRPSYQRPDAVWYAWIDRAGTLPREYIPDESFMRTSRVHQYALDTTVKFGGVTMAIDWNYVSLGATSPATPPASCDQLAARIPLKNLRRGLTGPAVRLAQCLVLPGDWHPAKTSGRYDAATARAVRTFQVRRGLQATGTMDRRTWISLLSRGHTPILKKGARGEPVERLQRTLNAALPARRRVHVDGDYGAATARAVKAYRRQLGLAVKPVVTERVWRALERGRSLRDRAARAAAGR